MTTPVNTTVLAPPRAMVLGANGFLGRWMARVLTAAGSELVCVSRTGTALEMDRWGIRGRFVAADLTDFDAVDALISREAPDVLFNLAGYGVDRGERDQAVAERVNADLPRILAESCARLPASTWTGVRLLHVGSALEYGVTGGVLREDSAMQPTTGYGITKLAGTLNVADVARTSGLRACTGRLFTVFGPGEHAGRLFPTLLAASRREDPIPLSVATQTRDFAFAGDVVERLLQLCSAPVRSGEVVNVASGVMHTVREFVLEAARALHIERSRLRFGDVSVRPEEMSHTGVSVERLTALTGGALSSNLAQLMSRATAAVQAIGWQPA